MIQSNRKDKSVIKNLANQNEIHFVRSALLMSNFVKNIDKIKIPTQSKKNEQKQVLTEGILLIENYYTCIEFTNCNINLFALKMLIKWNMKSLRFIRINKCFFHLSDKDTNEGKNAVRNSRFFQEIDFVYYIQTFQFFDIEEIDIDLIKEISSKYVDEEMGHKMLQKDRKKLPISTGFIQPLVQNQADASFREHEIHSFDQVQGETTMSKTELIQEFACENQCRLISYEQVEKPSFIKSFSIKDQKRFADDLIWGDLIDPKKMEDKLNFNKIAEITQNLRFYKTYTKYALMENKLLIIGDVLYNNVSVQQLYNLIQLNYKSIKSIIFKDTGRIPSKTFIDLMNQLFIIPQIEEISFLSSVVEEDSFKDLQYLVGLKRVQFMVIYRSHFLQSEIEILYRMLATKKAPLMQNFDINHNRYTILELYSKKHYEFTPFAFQSRFFRQTAQSRYDFDQTFLFSMQEQLEDINTSQTIMMMDVESLYERQQEYPKLIYNRIIFYQGKNLSIVSRNISDRNLFKYWIFVKKLGDIKNKDEKERLRKAKVEIKQEELIQDLDNQLKQDDLNVVNCGLIKNLIGLIQEEELRDEYYKLYISQKSYQNLKIKYPIRVVENIRFREKYYLVTSLAYLMGFTRIQKQSLYFYINNEELHECLCSNKNDFSQLETDEYSLIIKESVKIGLDIQAVQILNDCIQFDRLTHLNLDGIRENTTFSYLNAVFQACVNLKSLKMRECLLNMNKISQINFAMLSNELMELDMSKNRDIDDFEFLNQIIERAHNLRKLILEDMQLSKSRLEKVKFKKISKYLEYLNLSNNNLYDCIPNLMDILSQAFQLKYLILEQCQLGADSLKQITFPESIVHFNISLNYNIELSEFINILPQINLPQLSYLEMKEINMKSGKLNSAISPNGSEKLYIRIEEIIFYRNQIQDVTRVNDIVSLCKNLRKFTLSYQNIDEISISNLQLDHLSEKLIRIDLSYNYLIKKCEFLNKIFEKLVNLQQFVMKYCALSDEKLMNVKFSLISEDLQEFDFSGNSEIHKLEFLNDIMKKCQKLKILNLEQMKLSDELLKQIDFSLIGPQFEDLNISQNESLTKFYFLNDIFRKAKGLKKINLSGINLNETQFDHISFDNVSFELESFKIDERKGDNKKSFTDWLIKKLNRYLNIYRFQKHHANVDAFPFLNYFGVSEAFNLTQYRMSKEEIRFKQKIELNQMPSIMLIPSISGELGYNQQQIVQQKKMIENKRGNGMQINQVAQNNYYRRSKIDQEQNRVHLSEAVNIFYFYSFFKKLEQVIAKDTTLDQQDHFGQNVTPGKSKEQWRAFLDRIVEDQNVYIDIKYLLLQYINDRALLESLDLDSIQPEDLIQYIKILDLSNKKCAQNSFVRFALSRCDQLQKINLQKMQPQLQEFFRNQLFQKEKEIQFCKFNQLEEINISQNQGHLSQLINSLLENSPNLKILHLQDCNLKDDSLFQIELLPSSLLQLDLSENKNLSSLLFLNAVFAKCSELKLLNLSDMKLTNEKLEQVQFQNLSVHLENLNLSNNNTLNSVSFLNVIITRCKKLQILNISNLNIDHIKNKAISYNQLSPHLKEINISKNSIVFFMDFLANLIAAAPNLELIDMSYQFHINSYESQIVIIPPNKLKVLNISGNVIHNTFEYAPELISKSQCFSKLIVQEFNLQKQRFKSLMFSICDHIEELDISNNDTIIDITPLNNLNKTNRFKKLIARNTCLNNYLLNQLDKTKIFTNLQTLDFSYNISILDFSFFNTLFQTATNLMSLNMSFMQAYQSTLQVIDFTLTPQTLEYFDISGNDQITEFTFLNTLFERTQSSLKYLHLSAMNLADNQLDNVNFDILQDSIEYIDMSKNPSLIKIKFLSKIMNEPLAKLKKVKLDRFVFDIKSDENEFSQVEKLECDHVKYKYNFFTHERYVANINIIKFIKFLQLSYKIDYLQKRKNEVEERYGNIFQLFLRQLLKSQSEQKNLQVVLHFFFLLCNEDRLRLDELKESFFIFSPYSMFQKSKIIDFRGFQDQREDMLFDSYNLTFFDLDMVEEGTKYIFSYDKFYFPNFNEFYIQDFRQHGQMNGDMYFIQRINELIIKKKAEQAFLPIKLQLNGDTLKTTNLNEFQLLYLINRAPPASMQLKKMSIQFVKSWYVINYYAPLSCNTQISVDFELIENTSIGNFLTLNSYKWLVQNYHEKNLFKVFKYFIGYIGYTIFKVFFTLPMQFRFDHTVILLEKELNISSSSSSKRYNLLRLLFPLYQFVCIFGVLFFSISEELGCGQGISWNSYIMYGVYGFITFLMEADQFVQCLSFVSHLIPEFKADCQSQFPYNYINKVKQILVDLKWLNLWYLNYSISFIQSQLTRFDYFTDIGFLYSLYTCSEYTLFWISLSGLVISFIFNVIFFIYTFTGGNTYEKLATGRIDKLYQVCSLVSFWAVAELLNIVSPSNSITYKNRMYNSKIVSTFVGILFENIPQIIIQIIFLSKKNVLSINILFSIITSVLMFFINLYKFLTIIPSRLGQEDFNALNTHKKNEILPQFQRKLQEFESNLLKYNLVEQLKCIKSTIYYKKLLIQQSRNLNPSQIQKEIKIAKELRRFQHNLDLIEYFFGNTKFIDRVQQNESSSVVVSSDIQSQDLQQNIQTQQKDSHTNIPKPKSHFMHLLENDHPQNNSEDISDKTSNKHNKESNPLLQQKKIQVSHDYSEAYLNKSNEVMQEILQNTIATKPVHIQHMAENTNNKTIPKVDKTNNTYHSKIKK